MAKRYPLVLVDGLPREISATDRVQNSGNITVAGSAPLSPQDGDMWYDTANGVIKVYLSSSTSWVNDSRALFQSSTAPTAGMEEGDFWYNSTSLSQPFSMYIGTGWVSMSGSSSSGGSISDILAFSN